MAEFDLHHAKANLKQLLPEYLADLELLVNIDSGTFDKAGVDRVGAILRERYASLGGELTDHPHDSYGDSFSVIFHGTGRGNILLVGHTDTVFSLGTANERPFTRDSTRAYGPGVADMKSGDLSIVHAIKAILAQSAAPWRRLIVVHNSDEEIGSPTSRDLIRERALEADAVLVLEPGRQNGDIVSARKGVADCRVNVFGQAAHAGVNHDQGRSALLELAHVIVALEGLNGSIPGATLNVGQVTTGERINVVPDHAFAHFEVRAYDSESLQAMLENVQYVVQQTTVSGTRSELAVSVEHAPMHRSPEIAGLVELAQSMARTIGFELHDTATGGASDGNTAAAAGRPVLDGLGPIGGGAHSTDEYIELDSIVPRTSLLAGLIEAIGTGRMQP